MPGRQLTELLTGLEEVKVQTAMEQKEMMIGGLTADSREVRPGDLFAALPGARVDGRDFIDQAVGRGADAVLAPVGTSLKDYGRPVSLVTSDEPRRTLAQMAARFHGRQPRTIAAVTGTSGKTSVADFLRQIWTLADRKAASLGTLGLIPATAASKAPPYLTTPDPVALHACLKEVAEAGYEHLALEASSHGLDQYRLDGLTFSAAAFTNLSQDHLDYHPDMESYLNAKARLFGDLLPTGATAVLNADAPEFDRLAALCEKRGIEVLSYGLAGDDLRIVEARALPDGIALSLRMKGQDWQGKLDLIGTFQGHNVLAALGLALATGLEPSVALEALPKLVGVPGRLQRVAQTVSGAQVFVDYAHKPGALEAALTALRPHAEGRLIVVFGAGGDRDRGKRPLMGEIATRLADVVLVTDDNPRSEDPVAIRAEILAAAPGAREVSDRGGAIAAALAEADPGDLVLIAGKGHETGQIVGDKVLPFDDSEIARRLARGGQV
ncbi:UDP-N-acetylmuramoyl-L-alanyl-D-glutamate--2,6-diaminopimelate ligase [Limibacillus sp. MBR-115]|jgi:UDP-N-acetylmuramoyl-L-alanyl-D-glutamate--2,6-diaminopimelate ligase|uniref:UDP-N-acetylmuramoyl-L-alanyl-D-glutamate--2, 6-diaminopimelate ligase n=1 Tax=Limibacillus sp. MBR-115 TaxID=3156465 RepID=UPI00339B73FB